MENWTYISSPTGTKYNGGAGTCSSGSISTGIYIEK